jgi:uncharacterized phiE125 gp8 family phage protein
MGIRLITAATLEPVTVAEAKANAADDGTENDAVLWPMLIAAARERAEQYMGAAIMQRTLEQTLDRFPLPSEADTGFEVLPAWNKHHTGPGAVACPLLVSQVQYVDTAGTTQTLAGASYMVDETVWPFWLLPAVDTEWPSTREQANAVTIRYVVGYDAQNKVPPGIRGWMLVTTAFLYAQREAMVLDGKVAEIPNRYVDAALDPYRQFKL